MSALQGMAVLVGAVGVDAAGGTSKTGWFRTGAGLVIAVLAVLIVFSVLLITRLRG